MSTVSSNKLWYAAWNGKNDAVLAAIAAGGNINLKNYTYVSDNDI